MDERKQEESHLHANTVHTTDNNSSIQQQLDITQHHTRGLYNHLVYI